MRGSELPPSPNPSPLSFHGLNQPQNKWQCLYLKVTPTMLFGHGIG